MRELTSKIAGLSEHVVLDMEAGVEHLSRGTVRSADTLLVVAEPYYKSLETAARVVALGKELGISRVFTVANKVRTADQASILKFADNHALNLIAEIGHDESVCEADRLGIAPFDHDADSVLVRAVDQLADRLLPS